MAQENIYIFKISSGYNRCRVWHGWPTNNELVGTSTIEPDKELSRKQRYEVIAEWLSERFGLHAPDYQPTKAETSRQPANPRD